MEMNISARNGAVSDRFREYATEKIEKVSQLAKKVQRLDLKVTKQPHARNADNQVSVEIAVVGSGPAIRAEAHAADKFAAFDLAFGKLLEQLRRARDRRKVHHGRHAPVAVHEATASLPPAATNVTLADALLSAEPTAESQHSEDFEALTESPVEIRRKVFPADEMTADDAVDRMELVGHPFYLYIDKETGCHSVVYRRRGWSYGIISLENGSEPVESTRSYRDTVHAPEES
ncbi:ribosome hibernation-promoting factor, HPF/YfiA family [Neomicrococcus aestuarii]|uniref:Ribosome hibernation promoting factor n=1 Tax=Neomicrococcus aestuarii TaxID=556325 RepID=A0A1L2ZKH6_9MICC|nr:ribosome-associated translation inhibitor RaiA [Neomicrococcus aestuarii]APF39710.1 ribosomal subunit interface protein [Neomicrococcus aestuarii]